MMDIYFRPLEPDRNRRVMTSTPSRILEILREVFGNSMKLHREHVLVLQGMAAVYADDTQADNPFQQLADAVQEYGSIEIEARG